MRKRPARWMMSIVLIGVWTAVAATAGARELEQDTYRLLSQSMTEGEVVGRTGAPDRRLDQYEPTPQSQRLVSYQYVWSGDTSKGEWTTTITFSANTNKVIRIERDRK